MKRLLFILTLLSSLTLAAQNSSFKNSMEQAKKLLEQLDTTKGSLYQQSIQNLKSLDGRSLSTINTDEALKAGYGTSIWDKPGEYYSGMDLKKYRAINRREFFLKVLKISGIVVATYFLIVLIVYLIKRAKNKESDKELLIYIRKSRHSCNNLSSESDQ